MSKNNVFRFLATPSVWVVLASTIVANAGETPGIVAGLVPKPARMETRAGAFHLPTECQILFQSGSSDAKRTAEYLATTLRGGIGFSFPVREEDTSLKDCIMVTTAGADASLGKEGYQLEVTPDRTVICAPRAAGLFYGAQTLRQLLPAESFGSRRMASTNVFTIPCVSIVDYPRFAWRGMHLDVSRRFFDLQFVKRYLDHLAMHKINVFHWHLTDDDGWRIEIKKYPKLTRIGAWRGPTEALPSSYESGNQRYGGFYTQNQIREIVRYAANLHILVVPEVDVPAHCRAAIVAYPELLCTGDPYKFKSAQEVAANVLCPSQEKTYQFLEGVFGELADLFPGPWIHAGGDERPAGPWEQCERCQKRMKQEKLVDGRFLQDRFLKRLQIFLKSRGKKMIGWDELEQESVLDKDYTVMAWNSVEAGIAAARKGYPVIMAPSPFTYLDLSYSEDPIEPGQNWAGVLSVKKAYSFDPNPATLPPDIAARIFGVHGCLWSEMLVTSDRPDYMAYPRLCALAEIGWTPQSQRVWQEFWSRLCQSHLARLDAAGIAYRIPLPSAKKNGDQITIVPPYENAVVRYTLDGSEPELNSMPYTGPFNLVKIEDLKIRTFRPDGRGSRTITGTEAAGQVTDP